MPVRHFSVALQTVGLCGRSERFAAAPELMTRLAKGLIDAIVFILNTRNKREVAEVMKKHLRLTTDEDAETSYLSVRSMTSLDIAPDPAAWKNIQKFIARVNPKAGQVDVNDSINMSVIKALEENGYLAEARKRVALQAGR